MNIFRKLSASIHRRSLKRRVKEWGETIERLEQTRKNLPGNIELAQSEMHRAKRELAEMDLPRRVISHAPGRGPRDGVVRFSLVGGRRA